MEANLEQIDDAILTHIAGGAAAGAILGGAIGGVTGGFATFGTPQGVVVGSAVGATVYSALEDFINGLFGKGDDPDSGSSHEGGTDGETK